MDIEAKGLCKAYGEKQVLEDFDAVLKEGKTTCIMAPSGRGKTTLLRLLMKLEQPDRGSITGIEGRRLAAVFQEDRLCENLSVLANVLLVQKDMRLARERAEALLKQAGIYESRSQPARELSGGMRRRCAIVRALLSDWDILFLDEPFQGLDEENKKRMGKIVKNACRGKTVVLVTHERKEAEMLGAELLVL